MTVPNSLVVMVPVREKEKIKHEKQHDKMSTIFCDRPIRTIKSNLPTSTGPTPTTSYNSFRSSDRNKPRPSLMLPVPTLLLHDCGNCDEPRRTRSFPSFLRFRLPKTGIKIYLPSPSLSKREKASLNSAICSSVS